jgi:hypothetical protein
MALAKTGDARGAPKMIIGVVDLRRHFAGGDFYRQPPPDRIDGFESHFRHPIPLRLVTYAPQ